MSRTFKDACLHSNLSSLNVVFRVLSIILDKTPSVVQEKLELDPLSIAVDNLVEMLTFYVETTFFPIGVWLIYQLEEGIVMESPLS